jgi:transketolase
VLLVAAGYMVHECLKAADELAKSGKKAGVIDAYGLPLKDTGILDIAAKSGRPNHHRRGQLHRRPRRRDRHADRRSGAGIKLKALFVHQIPKSGREPQDVLDYLHLGPRSAWNTMNKVRTRFSSRDSGRASDMPRTSAA